MNKNKSKNKNIWVDTLKFLGIGWYIACAIVLGAGGGMLLDKWLGTSIFVLIGLLLGLVVAFWGVYRMIAPMLQEFNGEDNKKNTQKGNTQTGANPGAQEWGSSKEEKRKRGEKK